MHQDSAVSGAAVSDAASGPVPAQLAVECASFDAVEAGHVSFRIHFWECPRVTVVLGRSSGLAELVHEDACRADGVPIVRRRTGGGAVVLAPGCLNYAVVLPLVSHPGLLDVAASFACVLGRLVAELGVPGLRVAGGTDLALDGRKVSGNAQRRGRRALLQHGTLLHDFDAQLAVRYLKEPARQPRYRAGRAHAAFLGNLPLDPGTLLQRARWGLGTLGPAVLAGAVDDGW